MTKLWGALAVVAVLGGCVSNQNKPEEIAFCAREAGLPAGARVVQKQFGDAGSVTRFQPMPGMSAAQLERANMCLASRSPNQTVRDLALRGFPTGVQDCRLKYAKMSVATVGGAGAAGLLFNVASYALSKGIAHEQIRRCLAPYRTTPAEVTGTGPYRGGPRYVPGRMSAPVSAPVRGAAAPSSCAAGGNVLTGGAGYCTR